MLYTGLLGSTSCVSYNLALEFLLCFHPPNNVGISGIINRSLPDRTKAAFARSKFQNYIFQGVNWMYTHRFVQVNMLWL